MSLRAGFECGAHEPCCGAYCCDDAGCYEALENDFDRAAKGWVKLFNQHDLYTKARTAYTEAEMEELRTYYSGIINKYLPAELEW